MYNLGWCLQWGIDATIKLMDFMEMIWKIKHENKENKINNIKSNWKWGE